MRLAALRGTTRGISSTFWLLPPTGGHLSSATGASTSMHEAPPDFDTARQGDALDRCDEITLAYPQ